MYYIGIDLGTSSVKLLVMDQEGSLIKTESLEYPVYFPKNGYSEQNPADWFAQSVEGLKRITKDLDKSKVKAISFSGQMHGLVALDKGDEVIRPAILWNDGRSIEETKYLNETIGKDKIQDYTGNIAFAGFTAPKIIWMYKNERDNFDKISKIMLPKDYLVFKFTGNYCTDYSDAAGSLLIDVKNKTWSKDMVELCHIENVQLPKLYKSNDVVGCLNKKIADEIGLNCDVKVVMGAADNVAAAIGTGTIGDGSCNISLGTSGTIFVSNNEFKADDNYGLHSFIHADGSFYLMGCMLSAASCNKWWISDILKADDFNKEQNFKSLGKNHVFYLPYLMGERSPHNDPLSRSCFIGMNMDTSREEMTQAVFEGVAFGLRDSLEIIRKQGIKVTSSRICGGGAKSPIWKKIVANILNLELEVPMYDEGPAYGAAILAMSGDQNIDLKETTNKLRKIKEVIKPDENLVELYNERYSVYSKLYPSLKDVFQII